MNRIQKGFTLIELMIALVLGLLITAAVIQVYITNIRTAAAQKSGSEIQDASIFGLQQLESRLRMANMGNPSLKINDTTANGGVVLSLVNINTPVTETAIKSTLTHTAGDAGFSSTSNTKLGTDEVGSDQLTIQFQNLTDNVLPDCESADIEKGEWAIERYFIRASTTTTQGLVLACDAGRVNASGIVAYPNTDSKSFGKAGQEFILGVDQFKILLGTQSATAGTAGQMQYISPQDYMGLSGDKPPITAVKMGVIVRGRTPVVGTEPPTTFDLFGQTYTIKDNQPKLIRRTYESTSLLRNARVVAVDTAKDLKGSS